VCIVGGSNRWVANVLLAGLAIGGDVFVDDIRSRTIELIGKYKRLDDVSLRHV